MRTTISIDDDLLRDLRQRARQQKASLTSVVNDTIRKGLRGSDREERPTRRFRQRTYNMGPPLVDLTKALALAAELEDEEILKKMAQRK